MHALAFPDSLQAPRENITGTRGAFKTYSTTKPKIVSHFQQQLILNAFHLQPTDLNFSSRLQSRSRHGSPRSPREDDLTQLVSTHSAMTCNLHLIRLSLVADLGWLRSRQPSLAPDPMPDSSPLPQLSLSTTGLHRQQHMVTERVA